MLGALKTTISLDLYAVIFPLISCSSSFILVPYNSTESIFNGMTVPWSLYLAAIVVAVGIYRLFQVGKRDPRMPKGPPTIPILGNAHQIPSTGLYKQ